jgi:type IV pilus assembly protein PilV
MFNTVRFSENTLHKCHFALDVHSHGESTMKLRHFCESGFSLIEVLIAAAIFSIGLGGLSLLLLTAVMGTAEAGHQTFATNKANSLAEMISMNSSASSHYINPPPGSGLCVIGEVCSGAQLAAADLGHWLGELALQLPRGTGMVCRDSTPDDGHSANPACDGAGSLVIKVFWLETRFQDDEDGGLKRLVARLPR